MPENYQVENEEIKHTLKELGGLIASQLPKGWGFSLLIFNFGENGAMFYLSNAERQDMIKAMKEFIAKQEAETNARK